MSAKGLMTTYKPLPISFERGEGVWLYDKEGKKYLDALGGIAVCGLGHCHPNVTTALQQQAATLLHTSNIYQIEQQQALGERLVEISGMDACFFGNSGAEANECAIKLARLYGHHKGIEKPTILVTDQSFHGRTLATLSATGNRKVQAGFEPLVQGFVRVPFNDLEAVRSIAEKNQQLVAILVEPVQGEGGINIPADNYLSELRNICDQHGLLLMLDEIQTGNGRTGSYFAYQESGILPDVVTTAKGLGNGLPIGACLAHGKAASLFHPGNHGSTFGGNPLACAAGQVVVETLNTEEMRNHVSDIGDYLQAGLRERLADAQHVVEVRGRGLMVGVELNSPCAGLVKQALDQGLLINVTAERVVRLLPPLIISRQEVDALLDILCPLILQWPAQSDAA